MPSFQFFINTLKEAVAEIIPLNHTEGDEEKPQKRFHDNKRPLNFEEENFFKYMKQLETNLTSSILTIYFVFNSSISFIFLLFQFSLKRILNE
jgi:hypothetical protein